VYKDSGLMKKSRRRTGPRKKGRKGSGRDSVLVLVKDVP